MNKILIAYYSKSGNTAQIANELAALCDADLEHIKCAHKNDSGMRFIRTLFQTVRQSCIAIEPTTQNPQDYDVVVIGTPVWMFKLSSVARAYLRRHESQFKQLAFFCTEGGSGDEKVFQQMMDEVGQRPTATLAVTEAELKDQSYKSKLSDFANALVAKQEAA